MLKSRNKAYQFDLFAPYITDLPLRDQRDLMERPCFSLSKRKRLKPILYQSPDGSTFVKVQPHQDFGMATIWDADILIWAASVITQEIERRGVNDAPGPTLHFQPYNLLKAIHRDQGGINYQRLRAALDRLRTTSIKTNIRTEHSKKETAFSWLDEWTDDTDQKTGFSRGMSLTLSRWLYDGIIRKDLILSIHPSYFDLTGGLERWLYRVARKHAGSQKIGWTCTVQTLYEKSGSDDALRKFKAALKRLAEADELPEFHLEWIAETESGAAALHMIRRSLLSPTHPAYVFPVRRDSRRPATV